MEFNNDAQGFFRFIHSSPMNDSWNILESVLKILNEKLYIINVRPCDKAELDRYIRLKIQKNIQECQRWAKMEYKGLWQSEIVYINGVAYNNLCHYKDMLSEENLLTVFGNDSYAEIHGDLTIENIVCCHEISDYGWYLIDPNDGNMHETPNLDLAKLLQSLHGRYEFLMMVENVQIKNNCIEFLYTYSSAYHELYKRYKQYLTTNYSREEVKSIYYHEVVHWLRLMPYKIKKNPETAVIFYAGMLIVLDDVEKKFRDENENETSSF